MALRKVDKSELFRECLFQKKLLSNLLVLLLFLKVSVHVYKLAQLTSLKIAYFHYDNLVSGNLLLACHIQSIKTVSHQERNTSHLWELGYIYDHYFLAGKGFKEPLIKRLFCVQNYHNIGLLRKQNIQQSSKGSYYKKYVDLKKIYTLIVCYDIPPKTSFMAGLLSEITSESAIQEFYQVLIKLAQEFNEFFFVIKPKSEVIFDKPFYKQIEPVIKELPNFEVITDLKKYNPYPLAYLADLIIGKQTSILEEAFAAGKKIIVYDSEQFYKSTTYYLNEIDVIETNYDGLRQRVSNILKNDDYLDQEEWEAFNKKYFLNDCNSKSTDLIKKYITKIYNNDSFQ